MAADQIIVPPSFEVRQCADVLEEATGQLLRLRHEVEGRLGRFEADLEAMLLINLIVRYIESTLVLARHDLVLLPAACVASRAAFETCARATWLLAPDDPFERECRWLAHLASELDADERSLRMVKDSSFAHTVKARLDKLAEFHAAVQAQLPNGYKVPAKVPNLRRLLEEIGKEEVYLMYIRLSQYVHGTHIATRTYRKHIGTAKQLGEYIQAGDWKIIFEVCWWSLVFSGSKFIQRATNGCLSFPSRGLQERAKEVCESI